MSSQWTPEAIRALGATTDLPTLGSIFGLGRWRSYQMPHTGKWEQAAIHIIRIGARYRVTVQSILDVLGNGAPADSDSGHEPDVPARTDRAGTWRVDHCGADGPQVSHRTKVARRLCAGHLNASSDSAVCPQPYVESTGNSRGLPSRTIMVRRWSADQIGPLPWSRPSGRKLAPAFRPVTSSSA
jgi:hypothetical protein